MKKTYLFLIIIYSAVWTYGQTIRFNKSIEIQDTAVFLTSIIETDTGYVIKGLETPTTLWYPAHKIALFYFDKYGNITKWQYYGDSNAVYSAPPNNNLKKDKNGNYITAGIKEPYSGGESIYLLKYTNRMNLLWKKNYCYVDSLFHSVFGVSIDNSGNYIIYGCSYHDGNGNLLPPIGNWYVVHPFIMKVDSTGNLIYFESIAPDKEGIITGITFDQNNHYWASASYSQLYYEVPTIFECDSNAQILWFKNFGPYFFNSIYPHYPNIYYLSKDSSILFNTRIQTRADVVGAYYEPYMAKIKNHHTVWDLYTQEDSSLASWISFILETDNHYLIIAGNNNLTQKPYPVPYDSCPFVDSTGITNQLLKLTPDGNCMWRRNLFVPGLVTTEIVLRELPSISHIIQTEDEGFALIGMYARQDTNTFIRYYPSWFIKTDSLGCDGTGSCSDTAMVLNLLSAPDTICAHDTTWLTFELNGLSAPFTLFSSDNIQISGIYFIKDPYSVFATDTVDGSLNEQPQFWFDTSRVVPNHLYQQFPVIANTTDSIYSVTITLQGYYGRSISHTYSFIVKDCHLGNSTQINQQTLAIYPNPSTGDFTVSLLENPQGAYLTIANATGQIIRVIPINKGKTTYRFIGNLPPGTYFIGIDNGKGTVVKKLIVNDK